MAILYWSDKFRHDRYHNEPYKFDIHDWRLLREGSIYIEKFEREETGVYISAKENIRFIPHLTISDIMHFNNKGKYAQIECYHIGYRGTKHALTYCNECRGVGKFDWIQSISPERKLMWGDAPKHFIRDESVYYIYPGFDNYIFARVQLEPGETHCKLCKGTGLEVDGRHGLYKGMKGIKQKLLMVDAQEYNDHLKLKGLLK